MPNKTVYSLMFIISCALVGFMIKLPKVFDWCVSVDALSLLFTGSLVLMIIGLVGWQENNNQERMDQKLHDDRQERVRWMLENKVSARTKELMQSKKVDVE